MRTMNIEDYKSIKDILKRNAVLKEAVSNPTEYGKEFFWQPSRKNATLI